jgi:crossover junction endodeoxyribonuclease RuvC
MIILGIDPGTATTGFGVIEKKGKNLICLDCGTITTSKDLPSPERLKLLSAKLTKLVNKYQPQAMAVETVFFFKNLKTAMPVSEARGVILLTAAKKKLVIEEFTPLQVKMSICNYGRAEKKQVQRMVKEILNLEKIPRPDDAADALAIAICLAHKTCLVDKKRRRG